MLLKCPRSHLKTHSSSMLRLPIKCKCIGLIPMLSHCYERALGLLSRRALMGAPLPFTSSITGSTNISMTMGLVVEMPKMIKLLKAIQRNVAYRRAIIREHNCDPENVKRWFMLLKDKQQSKRR